MTARLIDGKALARDIESRAKERSDRLSELPNGRRPGLAVILVGEDSASCVYVRNKTRACERSGVTSHEFRLPAETTEAELIALVKKLNADPTIDGILVQLPLPKQINPETVIFTIDPSKDVDGFHMLSAGALLTGYPAGFRPCTPAGVMKMIEAAGCNPEGLEAVVVGRSNIVGKPQSIMLLEKNATVTIAHSRSKNLADITRRADILVAAAGRAKMITGDMVKPGAVVIDVGMNRDENGKLCGDVDQASVEPVAGALSPVPGGVGPMTIAMLIDNTLLSAERRLGSAR
ncbi:bifunctional methylenetetrahydrofolate dehydrogenase/methenyltetrahydrofolate cyclohydrolase FolD [Sutterella sp.]|uniref:bifunctional methylenetetrahydrofolate dehydrogenase/methenyltetrahydrofolate cyclohydrolase FolD n=1 Tax=Sutterella sp. TaxID=1981025 RepID=UPI0026DEA6DE|nr:bifunctional methylenetetrahydrofolate dehydrogenase/methenyltetrahydrofolate cyclohydrolase FolD [Sutterella sp.]MDO5531315.1 bifunctional methylenetetrahydrofolate dehydrogenase/methenyltetrahydrofolate cyclohydrolase FolD [Sutterella sp.]